MIEELKSKASDLKDHVSEYGKTYIRLLKAKATRGTSNAVSAILVGITSFILAFFILFFLGFGLGWWLGTVLNNRAAGFFIVAGFFLLLVFLLFALRKKVITPLIRNAIISKIYE